MVQLENARLYLQAKLGQRGAEMVEYALVLACVCAVGAIYYVVNGGDATNTLGKAVKGLWDNVGSSVTKAGVGTTTSGS